MDALTMQVLLAQQPRAAWQFRGAGGMMLGPVWCAQCVQYASGYRAGPKWRPVHHPAQCGSCEKCKVSMEPLNPV